MKNIYYISLSLVLFFCSNAYSQSSLDKRIEKANELVDSLLMYKSLKKVYLQPDGSYTLEEKFNRGDEREWYTLYFDMNDQLVKVKIYFENLDHEETIHHVLDNYGYSIYSLYHANSPMSNGYSVVRYMNLSSIDGYEVIPLIYSDLIRFEDDGDGDDISMIERIVKNGLYTKPEYDVNSIPASFIETNINELISQFSAPNFKEIISPEEYIKVQFVEPSIGDATHLKQNRVPLYEKLNSPIFHEMNSRDSIIILEKKGEWYKVRCDSFNGSKQKEGYIHKKFLAPVEREVK